MHNLVGDPKFATELNRHRKLLDAWLAKGDKGEAKNPPMRSATTGTIGKARRGEPGV